MIHEWKRGATVLTAKLSVCTRCGALRVEEAGRVHFIRRCEDVRDERVTDVEPAPCLAPARRGSMHAW